MPRVIVSDNGPQFKGEKIQAWCEEMMIKQIFIAVAHPQANGQVEVVNRVLLDGLKKRLEHEKQVGWKNCLLSCRLVELRPDRLHARFNLVFGSEAVLLESLEKASSGSQKQKKF